MRTDFFDSIDDLMKAVKKGTVSFGDPAINRSEIRKNIKKTYDDRLSIAASTPNANWFYCLNVRLGKQSLEPTKRRENSISRTTFVLYQSFYF